MDVPESGETSISPPITSKSEASFERFTSLEVEAAYRKTFSLHPVLGERERGKYQ